MEFVLIWFVLGLVAGAIASSRGRSFGGYFVLGLLLPLVGLILALALPRVEAKLEDRQVADGTRTRCPFCGELIRPEAEICRHCTSPLRASASTPVARRAAALGLGDVVLEEPWDRTGEPRATATAVAAPTWRPMPAAGQRVQLMRGALTRAEPTMGGPINGEIVDGTEVTVLTTQRGWAWVQADTGEEGWVQL